MFPVIKHVWGFNFDEQTVSKTLEGSIFRNKVYHHVHRTYHREIAILFPQFSHDNLIPFATILDWYTISTRSPVSICVLSSGSFLRDHTGMLLLFSIVSLLLFHFIMVPSCHPTKCGKTHHCSPISRDSPMGCYNVGPP